MRRLLHFILANWVAFVFCGCDSSTRSIDPTPRASAEIKTTVPNLGAVITHDFGILAPSETVTHTYRVQNKKSETVRIVGVEYQCGCTIASFSSKTIPPGGYVDANVQFRAGAEMGDFLKRVTLQLDDGPTFVAFEVIASVRDTLHVAPSEVILSATRLAKLQIRDFVLSKYTEDSWSELQINCSHPWITAMAAEIDLPPSSDSGISLHQQWLLSVSVNPRSELLHQGLNHGRVSVAGPEGVEDSIDVPVQFELKPDFSITPNRLTFDDTGGVNSSVPVKKKVILSVASAVNVSAEAKLVAKIVPETNCLTADVYRKGKNDLVWIIEVTHISPDSCPAASTLLLAWERDKLPCATIPISIGGPK